MSKLRRLLEGKDKKRPEYIRAKRRNRALWNWDKLYVPVTLATKCVYLRVAREEHMSLAELGLVVVEAAIRDAKWFRKAVKRYREQEAIERVKDIEAGRGT